MHRVGGVQGPEPGDAVGPSDEPGRYEIVVARDGSRLWNAVDRRGRDVIAHVTAHVAADEPHDWPEISQALLTMSTPNVARIVDAFTAGSATWIVSEDVDGTTLFDWVVQRASSTTAERLALLRQVAASLDDIHAGGSTGRSLTHGAVGPLAVVVQPNGRAVLTGVGGVGASMGQDAADFAVLVARCVLGDMVSEPVELLRSLAASAVGRQRARLVRQIAAVLDAPPEARPRRLGPWLDAALGDDGGTVLNERVGAALVLDATEPDGRGRRISRRVLIGSAVAAVVTTATIAVVIASSDERSGAAKAGARQTTSGQPAALRLVTWSWPLVPGCDATTSVAYTDDKYASPARFGIGDVRSAIARSQGGGAWYEGVLRFTIEAGSESVYIADIRPRQRGGQLAAPVWILGPSPGSTCPRRTDPPDHSFTYDITAHHMAFNGFRVAAHSRQTIEVTVRDCSANQAYGMEVDYAVNGQTRPSLDTDPMRIQMFGSSPGAAVFRPSATDGFTAGSSIVVHDKACA